MPRQDKTKGQLIAELMEMSLEVAEARPRALTSKEWESQFREIISKAGEGIFITRRRDQV